VGFLELGTEPKIITISEALFETLLEKINHRLPLNPHEINDQGSRVPSQALKDLAHHSEPFPVSVYLRRYLQRVGMMQVAKLLARGVHNRNGRGAVRIIWFANQAYAVKVLAL